MAVKIIELIYRKSFFQTCDVISNIAGRSFVVPNAEFDNVVFVNIIKIIGLRRMKEEFVVLKCSK